MTRNHRRVILLGLGLIALFGIAATVWMTRTHAAEVRLVPIGGDANPCTCSKRIE